MRKSERIMLLLRGGGEWSALEVAAVLGLWFGPYAELHRMEREGKIASRWLDMPYPRRRVYFCKGQGWEIEAAKFTNDCDEGDEIFILSSKGKAIRARAANRSSTK